MPSADKCWRDCDCNKCFLHRVTYALTVGVNQKDMKVRDLQRALLMLTHGLMLEEIGVRDVT